MDAVPFEEEDESPFGRAASGRGGLVRLLLIIAASDELLQPRRRFLDATFKQVVHAGTGRRVARPFAPFPQLDAEFVGRAM
jgi:hypothetical protein